MNILLAADGSEFTAKAAVYIVRHFEYLKVPPKVHLLHVIDELPFGLTVKVPESASESEAALDRYRQQANAVLEIARKPFLLRGIAVHSGFSVGEVAPEIEKYADRNNIDLIVTGSHGRSAVKGLILGSVCSKLLETSSIPMLIIRQ